MNFIIASIGIFIYSLIILKENKIASKNKLYYNSIVKPNIIEFEHWKNDVTDIDLEQKFKFEMCTNEYKIYEITSPIICSLNGFPDSFGGYVEYFSYMKSFPNMIARAYMGYYNKVLYNDAVNGIRSPNVYNEDQKRLWKLNHEFMKWLNLRIKITNDKYELRFIKGEDINTINHNDIYFVKLDDVNTNSCIGGKYCWSYSTNNISVF